uniref:Putative polyprotein n=1 Tax=Albugo laibachii Nc14 TaxID=890382 RepID=F0WQQ1_9STRA|nr:putative polyprotein [Albugo laibachii Nc14]|eukprot:CCA23660.1 putative polyprotein [Albugo laibachii Nc14]
MWPPPGLKAEPGQVCKLQRSLYGWKQASAVCYKTISNVFLDLKFHQCRSDACIFVRRDQTNFVYVALYVDDMLISAQSLDVIEDISNQLAKVFTMKKLGMAKFILDMKLSYNVKKKLMHLSQKACINRMVERFGQQNSTPVHNLTCTSQKLIKATNEVESMKKKPYRSLTGSLLYIAMSTRPDVAFAVCELSRFLEKPCLAHWNAGIRVLTYLKTTSELGLIFNGSNGNMVIEAYSDSDWRGSRDDRRSTSGIMVMVNGTPVVHKSRLQKSVALSSAEAEYMAMSMCVQEIMWVKQLLREMGHPFGRPIQLFVDNQSAIAIATNDGYQSRAKHIDIRHHFIREHVKFGNIKIGLHHNKTSTCRFLNEGNRNKTFRTSHQVKWYTQKLCRGGVLKINNITDMRVS